MTQPNRVTIKVETPIQRLVDALSSGNMIWGGGAGVHPTAKGGYRFERGADAEGGSLRPVYFRDPYDAVWAYLKQVGGCCAITIQAQV